MPLEPLWKGSELLHKLLADYLAEKIDAPLFCRNFEHAWNFDVELGTLSPAEYAIFGRLFDEVAWFSPFPEERAEVPHLRNEQQVLQAALAAQAELSGAC
jgi:hypothetical protein